MHYTTILFVSKMCITDTQCFSWDWKHTRQCTIWTLKCAHRGVWAAWFTPESSRLQMLILGWKCFHFVFRRNLLKLRCLTKVDFIVAIFSHLGSTSNLILSCRWETVLLPLLLFLWWFYCRFSRASSVDLWTFFRPEWAKGSSAKGFIKQYFKNHKYIMKSVTIS